MLGGRTPETSQGGSPGGRANPLSHKPFPFNPLSHKPFLPEPAFTGLARASAEHLDMMQCGLKEHLYHKRYREDEISRPYLHNETRIEALEYSLVTG